MGVKKVFVIIVTYKGQLWYDHCFTSLRYSVTPVQTVVVDNASKDGTVKYIKDIYPEIHLIASDKNLGFGQANNKGIRYALDNGADYILLLNQDAWIKTDTIGKLIDIHVNNPQYGILSPIHLNADETNIEKLLLNRLDDFRVTDARLFDDMYFDRLSDVYETKYVNAASWFMPRETIEKIGGFDPIFFHYGEDDNYLNRVFYHGYKVGICPRLKIVHDNDRPRPLYDDREQEVLLYIKYTNVNTNYNYRNELLNSFQKMLTNWLKLRFKRANTWKYQLRFLMTNNKALKESSRRNRLKAANWL
ncbi:MAG: glycosyltransferase family 2 protein [Paludibacter sp.]|nr:glycosyltransferase family 2 protein [Paludibacter sp.]